jgi:hypothetical protein
MSQGEFMPRECWCGRVVDRRGWGSHQRGHDLRATKDRFWSRVHRTKDCWEWVGYVQPDAGYGLVNYQDRSWTAHRYMYEVIGRRPIPDGLQVDHLCRNRRCVRPTHLEAVTPRVNTLRGMSPPAIAARTGRCLRGHRLEAWRHDPNGRRFCRTCRNARVRARRMERKTA